MISLFAKNTAKPVVIQIGNSIMTLDAAEKLLEDIRERRRSSSRREDFHIERANAQRAITEKLDTEANQIEDLINAARDARRAS